MATIKFVGETGAETVTVVAAELSAGFVSTADELLALAVLLMVELFKRVLSVEPTSVTVPVCPLPSAVNVMVRLSPAPLSQTPPGPAVQETKVMFALGKRSLIATETGLRPLFVIEML